MKSTELISTIILVVVIAVFLMLKSKKNKNSTWKGELIKKKDFTDEDNENHLYRLIFKTDDGKKVKVTVKEEIYNKAKIGDKYEKSAGDYIPKKTI
jgi:hypothetical protein